MLRGITNIVNYARCQAAIKEIESGMNTVKWLGEYLELFKDITYVPAGMPRITACNFQGRYYIFISQFEIFYMMKYNDIDSVFSNPYVTNKV